MSDYQYTPDTLEDLERAQEGLLIPIVDGKPMKPSDMPTNQPWGPVYWKDPFEIKATGFYGAREEGNSDRFTITLHKPKEQGQPNGGSTITHTFWLKPPTVLKDGSLIHDENSLRDQAKVVSLFKLTGTKMSQDDKTGKFDLAKSFKDNVLKGQRIVAELKQGRYAKKDGSISPVKQDIQRFHKWD